MALETKRNLEKEDLEVFILEKRLMVFRGKELIADEEEIANLKSQLHEFTNPEAGGNSCILELHKILEEETRKRKGLEEEVLVLQSHLSQQTLGAGQSQFAHSQLRDGYDRDGALMTNLHEQDIDDWIAIWRTWEGHHL
ncbi:hypothetical protein POM88_044205 [Heracleum sosnowskyi]|uniref:Uncharacterized protein n=1 Tax=Heracleum sosnowskyi TaxID=360622 RepID=A0AAD8M3R5_9APIA|nr:hypothetical protein POM88_044205 [Heracleum sosnowskyi]